MYYISIEGNIHHFVTQMVKLFHNVHLHRITNQSDLFIIKHKYFVFVPTYVRGVQFDVSHRVDESSLPENIEEMDTLTMNDELGYHKNYKNCLGIIGSGNRNFSVDCYCWTARHYHKKYGIPLIADYEIRGNLQEENVINHRMVKIWNHATGHSVSFHAHEMINPRLTRLENKYGKDLQGKDI